MKAKLYGNIHYDNMFRSNVYFIQMTQQSNRKRLLNATKQPEMPTCDIKHSLPTSEHLTVEKHEMSK